METKKMITDKLINEQLEAKGFGDKQACDPDLAKQSVLDHYNVEITHEFGSSADYYVYEETTADGYEVYVATHYMNNIIISEQVHQYDSNLCGEIVEYMKYSNGDVYDPELLYISESLDHTLDQAIDDLFVYLSERFEEEILEDLEAQGYERVELTNEI